MTDGADVRDRVFEMLLLLDRDDEIDLLTVWVEVDDGVPERRGGGRDRDERPHARTTAPHGARITHNTSFLYLPELVAAR